MDHLPEALEASGSTLGSYQPLSQDRLFDIPGLKAARSTWFAGCPPQLGRPSFIC